MHRPNNYGKLLLQLCKNFNLFIVNGRFGTDKGIGAYTCKHGSVVDYCIASRHLLPHVLDFAIDSFDSIFSDVHSCLTITIAKRTQHCTTNTENYEYSREESQSFDPRTLFKWDQTKVGEFREYIDDESIRLLCNKLESMQNVNVNDIATYISNLYISTASKNTFDVRQTNKKCQMRNKKTRKPWFNVKCKHEQLLYRRKKCRYRNTRSEVDLGAFHEQGRRYKRTISASKKAYQREIHHKLRTAKTRDPKYFWSTLSDKRNKKIIPKVDLVDLFKHFKTLNKVDESHENDFPRPSNSNNEELDYAITESEISAAVKLIKNGKACGTDSILNEHIKSTLDLMMPVYVRLFNYVLDSGNIPKEWLNGIIVPIYKNKGDQTDPHNYRGLTVLSCLGKLFTAIINKRLNKFCETNGTIRLNQAGFRAGFSTNDHLFVLRSLVELYMKSKHKKLYCLMIDYKQAFDTICRAALWQKLLKNGITGKCFTVITNMYENIKSYVLSNGCITRAFDSQVGVRQGENLSPLLFALYVNDLEDFLKQNGAIGIDVNCTIENVEGLVKLLVLLYADDTVILADSPTNLQRCIDALSQYCSYWKLTVNADKTKILIFSKRKLKHLHFSYRGRELEIVDYYKYLGVVFHRNGSFKQHKEVACEQARKAMYSILRKGRELSLPIDIQLQLFHTNVKPILLYACETWGYENISIIDNFHLTFLKMILKVKKTTPTCMVYGELGEFPLSLTVACRMVRFWANLLSSRKDKITYLVYSCLLTCFNGGNYESAWLLEIKRILDSTGLSYIWLNQNVTNFSPVWIGEITKQRLKDQFIQKWTEDINTSPKCINYRVFKDTFLFEKYLVDLPPRLSIPLCKFRLLNHKLPIETGRFIGTPRAERYCELCNKNSIGDEYHLLLQCPTVIEIRNRYIPTYYFTRPNIVKFSELWKQQKQQIAKMVIECKRLYRV